MLYLKTIYHKISEPEKLILIKALKQINRIFFLRFWLLCVTNARDN